jgi:geranylgeranyl pyrophosphate synthase
VRERAVDGESWREIQRLLVEHRALDAAFAKAAEHAERAKRHLAVFPPSPERDALLLLPDYVLARDH